MDEPPKKSWTTPQEAPCIICGNRDYEWGIAITSNDAPDQFLFFRPGQAKREDGDLPLYARKCNVCGNTQFFYH